MGSIDKFHGQNASTAYSGLNNLLVKHSPKRGKRLYNCCVVVPVTFVAKILRCVVEPIEQVATGAVHLFSVPFSKDKTSSLKKARDFLLVEFPLVAIGGITRIAVSPLILAIDEIKALRNPEHFEEGRKSKTNTKKIKKLEDILLKLDHSKDKKALEAVIKKMKHGLPNTMKEELFITRIQAKQKKVRTIKRPHTH